MKRPVLLVHGILGQRHVYWNFFRARLRREGVRFHELILPNAMLGDMRLAALQLRDKVDAIRRAHDVDKVDLVCHSAGGLVARYYLRFLHGDRRVASVVLMGTPNQGTWFGALFPLLPVSIRRQARPGSHFLQEIDGDVPVPCTNLWTPWDGVVLPAENALLPGADNVEMPWTTHWSFLWRVEVYDQVRQALGWDTELQD